MVAAASERRRGREIVDSIADGPRNQKTVPPCAASSSCLGHIAPGRHLSQRQLIQSMYRVHRLTLHSLLNLNNGVSSCPAASFSLPYSPQSRTFIQLQSSLHHPKM